MKARHLLALGLGASLVLAGCGGSTPTPDDAGVIGGGGDNQSPAPDTNDGDSDLIVDPEAERITEEQAEYLTELYEAALDEGGNLVIYSGLAEDMDGVFDLFEEMFPGLSITAESLRGAPLMQALQAEQESGNHVADVLQNPDAQRYVFQLGDFSQPYEVQTLKVPDRLANSEDQIIDPEFRYSTAFLGFFGLGTFLPRLEEAGGMPESFADLGDPRFEGLVGFADPTIPGPSQGALLYLLASGGLDEDSLRGIANNSVVKGDHGQTIAGLMQGEFAFQFAAPVSAVVLAAEQGAPVEFSVFPTDNPLVTHKHVLLDGAPNENAGKLYLEFLNLFSAQQRIAEIGFIPLDEDASDPDAPWTSMEAAGVNEIVAYDVIDQAHEEFMPLIEDAFAR